MDGNPYCILISAVPILSADGVHTGTRGAGVDVTELRRHERAQAESERRQELVDTILETIRCEFDPDDVLRVAATEIASALGADTGCILTYTERNAQSGTPDVQCVWNEGLDEGVVSGVEAKAIEELQSKGVFPAAQNLEFEGLSLLICGTLFGDEINGGLVLVRRSQAQPWRDEDRLLLRHIADQTGVILARVAHARALEVLSRVDPMTHLLNRRAFYADADLCLARNDRALKPAAYIYFDLDDFKRVNDTLGHGTGDALLVEFSQVLQTEIRRGDLAVRLGGDEFGLLLDNCDEAGAIAKAEAILRALEGVSTRANVPWSLSVSAGIALWRPGSHQTIEDVMECADSVLYEAKAAGKNAWRLAPVADELDNKGPSSTVPHENVKE